MRPQLKRGPLGCYGSAVSNRLYSLCGLQFEGRRVLFLWFTNDQDGVEQTPGGAILTFPDQDAALTYARSHLLDLEAEPPIWYDLDAIARWCDTPDATGIDCDTFLRAWNLLGDLGVGPDSIFRGADRRATPIYDKLFFGNNLPSVTPPGDSYVPAWSDAEVVELTRLFRLGLAELKGRLSPVAA